MKKSKLKEKFRSKSSSSHASSCHEGAPLPPSTTTMMVDVAVNGGTVTASFPASAEAPGTSGSSSSLAHARLGASLTSRGHLSDTESRDGDDEEQHQQQQQPDQQQHTQQQQQRHKSQPQLTRPILKRHKSLPTKGDDHDDEDDDEYDDDDEDDDVLIERTNDDHDDKQNPAIVITSQNTKSVFRDNDNDRSQV